MVQTSIEFGKLSARLINTGKGSTEDTIEIAAAGTDAKLKISFHRTIRVPDNEDIHHLPPCLGKFPLLPVSSYAAKFPAMARKGGAFLPMYQREAMWIRFSSSSEFIIKVYVGDINAISGEPARETIATMMRRAVSLAQGQSLQDYVVTPKQLWLDGICVAPGEVRQFVAMPVGSGYSVETQVLESDLSGGGLWFEVTASKVDSSSLRSSVHVGYSTARILVKLPGGEQLSLDLSLGDTVETLADIIEYKEGISKRQMWFRFNGQMMELKRSLFSCGVRMGSLIFCFVKLQGGGGGPPAAQSLAAGGRIYQNIAGSAVRMWDVKHSVRFGVQILNSELYYSVTGRHPPPTPIDAKAYAEAGYPFFKLCDEPSYIAGKFSKVKSVNEIDNDRAKRDGGAMCKEATVTPRIVILHPDGPMSAFRTVDELEKEVKSWNIENF